MRWKDRRLNATSPHARLLRMPELGLAVLSRPEVSRHRISQIHMTTEFPYQPANIVVFQRRDIP